MTKTVNVHEAKTHLSRRLEEAVAREGIVDTHALRWMVNGSPLLSTGALAAIEDSANTVLIPSVSAYELATKHRLDKPSDGAAAVGSYRNVVRDLRFGELSVSRGPAF